MKTIQVQTPALEPIVHLPGQGRSIRPPFGAADVKLSGTDTADQLEVIELTIVPGAGAPLHIHPDFDETFYVLDGKLTIRVADKLHLLPAGSLVSIPRGVVHTWKNATQTPIRLLQLTVPGGMEGFISAYAARPFLHPEEMAQVAAEFGTIVVGPPL